MQNNAWGKNMNTDSKKEVDDEYKPDIRVQRLWKSLEENRRKQRHEAFHKWLKNEYKYGENFIEVEEILEHPEHHLVGETKQRAQKKTPQSLLNKLKNNKLIVGGATDDK